MLPKSFFQFAQNNLVGADLLLLRGTYLAIEPVNRLTKKVCTKRNRMLINRQIAGCNMFLHKPGHMT